MKGLSDKQNRVANIAFYILGLCVIVVMLVFFGAEHSHGDEHDDHEDNDDHDDHAGHDH